ncbi:unnamed protein product, partial [Heterosigma akashiwo]
RRPDENSRLVSRLRREKKQLERKKKALRAVGGEEYAEAARAFLKCVRALSAVLKLVKQDEELRAADALEDEFIEDRWKCSKKILDGEPKTSGVGFSKEECEKFFRDQYSDPGRARVYEPPPGLPRPPPPTVPFNTNPPSWSVWSAVVRKKRNGSAPGINGISYKVYKFCPGVKRLLWELACFLWVRGLCPKEFQIGLMTLLIKKEGQNQSPDLMRPICVLNAEGRIFFFLCVAANIISVYMLANGYIDLSQQKAFLPGVAGCLEHAAKMLAAMKDAKENMRSMCVSFLDLAGAYPSVAHSLVQFALRWYHFPDWLSQLLFNYYECLCARVVTAEWESDLFTFLIGVFQGCTASVVIFLVVFQVLLDSHAFKAFALVYRFKQDPELLLRDPAFADDVALVSATAAENQLSIDIFQEILDWTITMLLKASKCRSWAIGR